MRKRRTDCDRGRTLDALDILVPGKRRRFEVRGYVTEETWVEFRQAARTLGITMGGLVALLVERASVACGIEASVRELLPPPKIQKGDHHVG